LIGSSPKSVIGGKRFGSNDLERTAQSHWRCCGARISIGAYRLEALGRSFRPPSSGQPKPSTSEKR